MAARIVKVLGADCGLDPGTKLLSVVSEWMETSPLVYRVCGEVYRPPHKWSDLAGAAKLWTGTQVRVLDGAPFRKLRCQFNVPSTANVAEAVDHIVSESIRRHALYKSNVRALHRVVGQIESQARDYLVIRERMREAQIAFLQRSCGLPVVALFSSDAAAGAPSSLRDIVQGLDWERIRVHYDVIRRAQSVGLIGTTRDAVLNSRFYTSSPPFLDVPALMSAIGLHHPHSASGGSGGQASAVIAELSAQAVGCDLSLLEDLGLCHSNVFCRRCCPALGLKWVPVCGGVRPAGSELSNPALRQALRETRDFSHCVFEGFKVRGLTDTSFIEVEGVYLRPAAPALEFLGGSGSAAELCVRCQVEVAREERSQALYVKFADWEDTLRLEKCAVCGLMVMSDCAVGPYVRLSNPLVSSASSGVRRCEGCAALERKPPGVNGDSVDVAGKWGALNNMLPSAVPPELSCLSLIEKMLVSMLVPMMKIHHLAKGGVKLCGNAISFRQPTDRIIKALPRRLHEAGMLFVVRGLLSDRDRDTVRRNTRVWKVRRERVRTAIHWLIGNCPPYEQAFLSEANLAFLPRDGSVFDEYNVTSCVRCSSPDGHADAQCTCIFTTVPGSRAHGADVGDLGPAPGQRQAPDAVAAQEEGEEEAVSHFGGYDTFSQSNVEDRVRQGLQNGTNQMAFDSQASLGAAGSESSPVDMTVTQADKADEHRTPYFWTMAYPWLFPDGKGDITQPNLRIAMDSKSFNITDYNRWRHILFLFFDNRFAEDPGFVFHLGNVIQRKQSCGSALMWNRSHAHDDDPSVEEIMSVGGQPLDSMLRSVHAISQQIVGTDGYWHSVRRTLEGIVQFKVLKGDGLPSFWISGSCAEFHHPPIAKLLAEAAVLACSDLSFHQVYADICGCDLTRRRFVRRYHNVVCEYFFLKTKQFIQGLLHEAWLIDEEFIRFEFAKSRGTIHFHGLLWRADRRPHHLFGFGASEEGQRVVQAVQAGHMTADRAYELERDYFVRVLSKFLLELGFSCEHSGAKPDEWPLPEGKMAEPFDSRVLQQPYIVRAGSHEASVDLDTKLRTHICSDYCVGGRDECRFGFGKQSELQSHAGLEGLYGAMMPHADSKLFRHHKGHWVLELPRNHPRVLQEAMGVVTLWGANMDIQSILTLTRPEDPDMDVWSVVDYVVSYDCKGNASPAETVAMYEETMQAMLQHNPARPLSSVARSLLSASVGERKIPHQQALYEGSLRPCYFSSVKTVGVSLGRGRILQTPGSGASTRGTLIKNLVDRYHAHILSADSPEYDVSEHCVSAADGGLRAIVDLSLYEFATCGAKSNCPLWTFAPVPSGIGRLRCSVPLKASYCRAMLRLYKPGYILREGNDAIYESEVEFEIAQSWIQDFRDFLGIESAFDSRHPSCPESLCSEYMRAEARRRKRDEEGRGCRRENSPLPDAGEEGVESDGDFVDEDLAAWVTAVNMEPDDAGDDFSLYRSLDWSRISLGTPGVSDYYGNHCAAGINVDLHAVAGWARENIVPDPSTLLPRLAPKWSREQVHQANSEQRLVISLVLRQCKAHLEGLKPDNLHLIVSGTAGTGKSFLLSILTFLVQSLFAHAAAAVTAAPTGAAADNVGGTTLHALSALNPSLLSGRPLGAPSPSLVMQLQNKFRYTKMVALDEMSLCGTTLLGYFSERLAVAVNGGSNMTAPFGDIPIFLLLGDHGQLGPADPKETRLCDRHARPTSDMGKRGQALYFGIRQAIFLHQMKRQNSNGDICRSCPAHFHAPGATCSYFASMLHRMRFGKVCDTDFLWAQHRQLSNMGGSRLPEQDVFSQNDVLNLVPRKVDAHNLNFHRFETLFERNRVTDPGLFACPLAAVSWGKGMGAQFKYDVFEGIPAFTVLCVGAPVTLTCNRMQSARLFNGSIGRVENIVFAPGHAPSVCGTSWPLFILVDFPDFNGPAINSIKPTLVPIVPVESGGGRSGRHGFPLKLAYCMTCHKAQGCTCGPGKPFSKVVVNLGDGATEVSWGHGIGFCALSRAMSGDCVAIDGDVTLSRLQRITCGKVRNTYLQEDTRLKAMHEATVKENHDLDFDSLVEWAYNFIDTLPTTTP